MSRSRLLAVGAVDATLVSSLALLGPLGTVATLAALATFAYCLITPSGLLIMLIAVSHITQFGSIDENLIRAAKWGVVAMFFCLAALRLMIEHREHRLTIDATEKFFLLYIFWGAICSLFAVKPTGSIGEVIRVSTLLPIYFIARYSLTSAREISILLLTFLISVFVAGLASMSQILQMGVIRVHGLFQNANMLGVFLSFALPALAIGFILTRSRITKALYVTGITFGLMTLLLSWSRDAYLSIAVQILAYLIVEKRKRILSALTGLTVLLTLTILATPTLRTLAVESLRLKGGTTHRTTLWIHGLNAFVENPVFGMGYDVPKQAVTGPVMWNSFVDFLLYSNPETRFMPHNTYIYALMSTGLIGLVLLFLLYRAMFRRQFEFRRSAPSPEYRKLHSVIIAVLIGTLAYGIFETSSFFGHGSWANYFWVLLGMATAVGERRTLQIEQPRLG